MSLKDGLKNWQTEEARRLAPNRHALAEFLLREADDEETSGGILSILTGLVTGKRDDQGRK